MPLLSVGDCLPALWADLHWHAATHRSLELAGTSAGACQWECRRRGRKVHSCQRDASSARTGQRCPCCNFLAIMSWAGAASQASSSCYAPSSPLAHHKATTSRGSLFSSSAPPRQGKGPQLGSPVLTVQEKWRRETGAACSDLQQINLPSLPLQLL